MGVIGYKVFNPDWTCRGFQYEVGKTFKHDGDIRMCGSGFHFCRKVSDCFNYYDFSSTNKVASVEAIGDVITEGDKSVTNEIKIIAELTWHEVLVMCNMGDWIFDSRRVYKTCGLLNLLQNNVGQNARRGKSRCERTSKL